MDERLLTDVFGQRRFYPPGQHPAAERLRRQIAALQALNPDVAGDRDRALAHLLEASAVFEEGESIAKANYLRRF